MYKYGVCLLATSFLVGCSSDLFDSNAFYDKYPTYQGDQAANTQQARANTALTGLDYNKYPKYNPNNMNKTNSIDPNAKPYKDSSVKVEKLEDTPHLYPNKAVENINSRAKTIQVGYDDNIVTIARAHNITPEEIAAANGLRPPFTLEPGRLLVIPNRGSSIPYQHSYMNDFENKYNNNNNLQTSKPANSCAGIDRSNGNWHVIRQYDTLYSLANCYKVDVDDIVYANKLGSASQIKTGERIFIPSPRAGLSTIVPATQLPKTPTNLLPKSDKISVVKPLPMVKQNPISLLQNSNENIDTSKLVTYTLPVVKPTIPEKYLANYRSRKITVPQKFKSAEVFTPKNPSMLKWRWPAKGKLIGKFGKQNDGTINEGINISLPNGYPVKAAEDGVIAYAGKGLSAYGNLILIKHGKDNDGAEFVTAYAHNSEILVDVGQVVRRGDDISKVGASGDVSAPQLHFELRKGTKSLNPETYLEGV